ncbi:HIT family protein [Sphingomonas sp. AP4-R1]|uniref:HIT family protein n=1 Tax=Sphingomonas sp. AP4-R1 TaxID=2735134 RepID=UPI0014936816|nr:HIT family protein [Sphingomonas sp. AP4-R1]QJU56463.1 HIT family protein [Sphingomonas sp. AP4-R1]
MDDEGPNPTILRFGYPATRIAETAHWMVLLRPEQPTLGSMILAAKSSETAFGALSPEAFADMGVAIARIEAMLAATIQPARINYLMLMMVDPHVHFHVLPRYEGERSHAGIAIGDRGWPKQPELAGAKPLDADQVKILRDWLSASW